MHAAALVLLVAVAAWGAGLYPDLPRPVTVAVPAPALGPLVGISIQVQSDLFLQQPLQGALHNVTQEIGLIHQRLTQARRQTTILQSSHRSLRSRVVSTSHFGGAMAPFSHEKVAEPPNLQSLRGAITHYCDSSRPCHDDLWTVQRKHCYEANRVLWLTDD